MGSNLSNIWKYSAFLITNKRVWVSIIAIYYLSIPGVNELGISYIILAGNVAGVIFELPSGYLADIIGHKKTLVISRVLAVISSLFYLYSFNIWTLILGSIFLSLSEAFTSGTGNAFMQETLKSVGRSGEYARIMGRIKSVGFSVPLLLSAFVPFLVGIDIKAPFVVGVVMDIIGLIIALTFADPNLGIVKVKEIGFGNLKKVIAESISTGFFKYAMYTGVLGGLLFAIGNYRGPFQEVLGISVSLFGVFFVAGRVFASVLLWFSGNIQKVFSIRQFFFLQTLLFVGIFLSLGLFNNPWVAIILFAIQNGIKWGLTEIEDSYFIELIEKSQFKATILSLKSLISQFLGGIAALLVGYIIFNYGYSKGFIIFSVILGTVMFSMYFLVFVRQRKNL